MIEKPKLESNVDNSFKERKIARLKQERDRILGFFYDVGSILKMERNQILNKKNENLNIKEVTEIIEAFFDDNFLIYPEKNLLKVNQDYLAQLHDRYDKGTVGIDDLLSLMDALEYLFNEKNTDIENIKNDVKVDKGKDKKTETS